MDAIEVKDLDVAYQNFFRKVKRISLKISTY